MYQTMRYAMMRFPNFLSKALTLSYDDGVIYDEKLISIMDKYGLKGTFNLNSGLFGCDARHLPREQVLALYKDSAHEVAIHGAKHLNLPAVSAGEAVADVIGDRIALEQMFSRTITGMAYPFGTYDDRVVAMLEACGVSYARTVISTERFDIPTDWLRLPATCHHANPRLMELAEEFAAYCPAKNARRQPPKLFYLWGHSYEFNDHDNWHIIEDFAKKLGGRDDIWYATNIEVYRYVKAFEALERSADGSMIYNPTATDVYLNLDGEEILVPAGKTVMRKGEV